MSEAPLALIAGEGDLPRLIAEERARRGAGCLVIRFEGTVAPWAEAHDVLDLPFEKPGRLFRALEARGCRQVCFAGAMVRPRLDPLRFDLKAVRLAPKVMRLLRQGDDAMLRGLAGVFEDEGYEVVAPHEQLAGLLAEAGTLGGVEPSDGDLEDAARAAELVRAIGAVDAGQAAVAAEGVCLGLEAIAGTDALLDEVARLPARLRPERGGVLCKAPKPGQDWRMDLPAIGPETVRRAAAAGLRGVCV
ncbi:MAG: LpxI family protein, partial [Pseudomonadota bacterium]